MNIKELVLKNKEIILYIIFGVATTVINIITYYMCAHSMGLSVILSSTIAWVISVLFAYITNKIWVFKSKTWSPKELFKECLSFITARLVTGGIDICIMFLFVTLMGFNDLVVKILSNVVVIILNYILSKMIVFREKRNN